MKKIHVAFLIVVVFALAAFAQEQVKQAKPKAQGRQETKAPAVAPEMEAYMKLASPNENHKLLEPFVGNWKAEVKIWNDPATPPNVSAGTAAFRMIYDGRFLQGEFTGEYMGHPFNGMELMGYDNLQKKFIGFWVDSGSTWFMTSTGTVDKDGKRFRMAGTMTNPMTMKPEEYRDESTFETPDRIVSKSFSKASGGKEIQTMEIIYTRVK